MGRLVLWQIKCGSVAITLYFFAISQEWRVRIDVEAKVDNNNDRKLAFANLLTDSINHVNRISHSEVTGEEGSL